MITPLGTSLDLSPNQMHPPAQQILYELQQSLQELRCLTLDVGGSDSPVHATGGREGRGASVRVSVQVRPLFSASVSHLHSVHTDYDPNGNRYSNRYSKNSIDITYITYFETPPRNAKLYHV